MKASMRKKHENHRVHEHQSEMGNRPFVADRPRNSAVSYFEPIRMRAVFQEAFIIT